MPQKHGKEEGRNCDGVDSKFFIHLLVLGEYTISASEEADDEREWPLLDF
jgi:hypothetical protein